MVNEAFKANPLCLGAGCGTPGGGEPTDVEKSVASHPGFATQHPQGLGLVPSAPRMCVCFPICKMKSVTTVWAIPTSKRCQEGQMRSKGNSLATMHT